MSASGKDSGGDVALVGGSKKDRWLRVLFWLCVVTCVVAVPLAVGEFIYGEDYFLIGKGGSGDLEVCLMPIRGWIEFNVHPRWTSPSGAGDGEWFMRHLRGRPLRTVGIPWDPGVDRERRWEVLFIGGRERVRGGEWQESSYWTGVPGPVLVAIGSAALLHRLMKRSIRRGVGTAVGERNVGKS